MATKTFKVSLSLDNPRIIQSSINVRSFDKQSIKIKIELTKNSQVYQIPAGAQIKISLLKLARQEQKIILDVPFTSADSIDWIVPDYLDGYQGEVRVGIYLIVGTENIDVGYFNITSSVSDIDSAAEEFTESVLQGWAIEDLTALLPKFQAVLDETTGKDVISAPEIILARNGEANLKARLDKEQQQVTAQLAQKASRTDLEVESSRIDTLIALPDGSTTNDARLEDIAIGEDGTVYDSPGNAVRDQISKISTKLEDVVSYETGLNKFNKADDNIITGYYISQSGGSEVVSANEAYGITPYMPIKPNIRYLNNSLSGFKTNIFYDINKNMIGHTLNNDFSVDTLNDVAYVRCNFLLTERDTLMFYEYDGEPKPYEPYKLIPVLGDDVVISPDKIPELVAKVNDPLAKYKSYYNALLNGDNSIYNINVIGDSISSGAVVGTVDDDYYKFSYLGLIRSKLAELFSDTGYGFMPCFHLAPQQKFVTTGAWSKNYTLMGVGQLSWYTYEAGATVSFPFKGTGVALMVRGTPTRGTIGVSIDGGAQHVINLAYPEAAIKFEKIEGLADGNHTCVITNLEAKEFIFFGAYEIKGTKGFRVNFCGRSGQATPQFAYNDSVMSAEIDIFQPVLTVIASITNDIGLSLDLTTYRNNLQTLVTRAKQYGDVILMANNGRTDKTHAEQLPYVNAMKDIADKNNCLFVDMYRRWDREAPTMGYMADTLHQNALGHTDMANALLPYLTQ